jgi:cysteinyl-tRNA synthetase
MQEKGLRLFNTLSRSIEPFVPRDPDARRVGMYCCGPTVYDRAHIGNFRTFVFVDLVRRYLEFRGYEVFHVMNVTDVEDKIIKRVGEKGIGLQEYTRKLEQAFLEDFTALGCRQPHAMPRATEHIEDIIALVQRLQERGLAYQASDGSVYFSIERYRSSGQQYGRLVNLNFEGMRPGERVSHDEYAKDSVADFALWKARVPEDGKVYWPSPWGDGRPGWHIECSAMSMRLLGPCFDLHLGGEDLVFPHHEDEIAQSEGAGLQEPGEPFVRTWVHSAHLLVEGKKMSKSLGNFFTLADLIDKGHSERCIRYLLLTAHYRGTFNFTLENLTGASSALSRLDDCLTRLREVAGETQSEADQTWLDAFTEAMDEDLNVARAWGVVFNEVSELNRKLADGELSAAAAAAALAAWERIDGVFGVGKRPESEVPPEITALLNNREAARKAKDFGRADELREQMKSQGWLIEDTPKGPRLKAAPN